MKCMSSLLRDQDALSFTASRLSNGLRLLLCDISCRAYPDLVLLLEVYKMFLLHLHLILQFANDLQ